MLPVSTLQQISPEHFTTSDTQQSELDDDFAFSYDDNFPDANQPSTSSYQRPGKTSKTNRPNLNSEPVLTFTNLDITSMIDDLNQPSTADDLGSTPGSSQNVQPAASAHTLEILTYQRGRSLLREHMLTTHRKLEGAKSTVYLNQSKCSKSNPFPP